MENVISKSVQVPEELKTHSPIEILESIFPQNENAELNSVAKSYLNFLDETRIFLDKARENHQPVVVYFNFDPEKIKCCAGSGHSYVCKVIHVGKSFMKIKRLAICGSKIDEEYIKREGLPDIFLFVDSDKYLSKVSY